MADIDDGPDDLEDKVAVADDVDLEPDDGEDGESGDTDDELEAAEEDDAEDGDEDPEPKAAKKEGRYATLARRAKEAEADAKAAREAVARLEQQQQQQLQQQNRAAWQAQEQAKLDLMLPEERVAYQTQQQLQAMQQQMAHIQFQAAEAAEKAEYTAKAATSPVYGKYASRVEKLKADLLREGRNVSRENLLKLLIGEDALQRGAKVGAKQKAAGSARRAAASGRQQSGRSDTASNSRREKTLEERLEGVLI